MARAESVRGGVTAGRAGSKWARVLAVCAVALGAANCAKSPQQLAGGQGGSDIDPKYGVKASKRLYNEGDTIPKGGGRRYSGKAYVVAGRTYVPREDARGYVREGLASWYGSAFHGRMTANGEVFDRHSIAAAHPTLPLPSYARVTNLDSGRSMVVRVNDRGPYHENRVMDVSEEAARALDFHRRGTARVRVEYLGKASIAGSDDRKLLATLRTDGQPAAIGPRSPVMIADLGNDVAQETERFARPSAPALAFREREEEGPAPARPRPAPILVASRASVSVPEAVQPHTRALRPANAPLSLAPPPLQLAAHAKTAEPASPSRLSGANRQPVEAKAPSTRVASTPAKAPMPDASKLAMAKLFAAAAPAKTKPALEAKAPRRRIAEVN